MSDDSSRGNFRPLATRVQISRPQLQPRRLVPKRSLTTAACESCRRRKTKCNGSRPRCSLCSTRDLECVYIAEPFETRGSAIKRKHNELQQQVQTSRTSESDLAQLFKAIRDRDPNDATAIMKRIRLGEDPGSILRHLQNGDLLLELNVTPETRFRHTFPYLSSMPRALQSPDNPYLASVMHEAPFTRHSSDNTGPAETHPRPQFLKPYAAADIVDPRLDAIQPSRWTSVSTDDEMMRKMFRFYFRHEHQSLPFFHKDYFLDDMISDSDSPHFCSPLLVNALLAEACSSCAEMSNRVEYWNPLSLRYKFMTEAKRLWELQQDEEISITTIQAAMILNTTHNMCSMDKLGLSYGAQAVAMGHRLNIFDPLSIYEDKRKRHVYGYTAWCLYYWITIQYYVWVKPPLFEHPPKIPLPDPKKDPKWYGEVKLRYPLAHTVSSLRFSYLFKAKCDMIPTVNKMSNYLFQSKSEGGFVSSDKLLEILDEYEQWFSRLPSSLAPANIVYPAELQLHLQYHSLVINLCERLVPAQISDTLSLQDEDRVRRALSFSRRSFETVMLLFYFRHGYKDEDRIMTQFLSNLAYMSLAKLAKTDQLAPGEAEETRGTLTLAAQGLSVQSQYFYLTRLVSQVLQSEMNPGDLNKLRQLVTEWKDDLSIQNVRAKHHRTQYPISIVAIEKSAESRRLGNLIDEYSRLALDDAGGTSVGTSSP